jgi:hypothetical protein
MKKFDMRMIDLLHWNEVEIALITLEKKMLFDNRLSINNLIMYRNFIYSIVQFNLKVSDTIIPSNLII